MTDDSFDVSFDDLFDDLFDDPTEDPDEEWNVAAGLGYHHEDHAIYGSRVVGSYSFTRTDDMGDRLDDGDT